MKLYEPVVKLRQMADGSFSGELYANRRNRKGDDVEVIFEFTDLWASEVECIASSAVKALAKQRDALNEKLGRVREEAQ
jgi:hypothetical protein